MPSTETDMTPSPLPSPRKVAWIAGIAVATLIPGMLVSRITGERQQGADGARAAIAASWGPEQVVSGPVLVLPATAGDGTTRYLSLAPRALDAKVEVAPTTRRRGLFAATVYGAAVTISGRFDLPDGFREGGADALKPGRAVLLLGATGNQGVREGDGVEIAGGRSPWQDCPDVLHDEAVCGRNAGLLAVDVDLSKAAGASFPFGLTLHLRGSGSLRVSTAAKHAAIAIAGRWPSPGFLGTDLPTTIRVDKAGFEGDWTIDRIGRPAYSQTGTLAVSPGTGSTVGVELLEGVPLYRTVTRVIKYGLLIVALAFAAFFLFEVGARVRVSLLQYGMLGASLSLFTLLLLSLSEVVGYEAGYAVCALMVTAQASLYALAVMARPAAAAGFAAMLATVFGFFYVLVGLESYSLVVGAVALFLVLSIIMVATEKVGAGRRLPDPAAGTAAIGGRAVTSAPSRAWALGTAVALMAAGLALRMVPRAIGWHLALPLHHYGGGFLWGGLVYALVAASRPSRWRRAACLAATLAIIVTVELFRAVHAPGLDAFRLTVVGQWLLGRVFAPMNIIVDGLGAVVIAAALGALLHPTSSTCPSSPS